MRGPSSIFSASFSSFQNSASNSFAGVGGKIHLGMYCRFGRAIGVPPNLSFSARKTA